MNTAQAILHTLQSPNVADTNLEPANVVDVGYFVSRSILRLATAITPDASAGRDNAGGCVTSLTEATMGITGGLMAIADAINRLASAVETNDQPAESIYRKL
jgi:hypothetical protein